MFKKVLPLIAGAIVFFACQNPVQQAKDCQVNVKVDFPQYQSVQLLDAQETVLHSVDLLDGKAQFVYTDTLKMPFVGRLVMQNPSDSLDFMTMPVVIERGQVNVSIANYIITSGTPNNVHLQHYLNDLQAWTDSCKLHTDFDMEHFHASLRQFIEGQIAKNKDNVVGEYIQHSYESSYAPADTLHQ